MAQPNVVREPSMDEILASIRRIIESNEPVTQASVATAMSEPEGFSGRPANDDAEEVTLTVDDDFGERDYHSVEAMAPMLRAVAETEVHASVAPVREAYQPSFAQPASPPQKALSLADVAARVRAASERGAMIREAATGPYIAMEQPVEIADEQANIPQPQQAQPVAEVKESLVVESRDEMVEHHNEDENSYRPEPVSLLSSSTGEQVARSFQDLAIAIDNAERRSLDQIAEDMLRPMLQEWLDDNLPTLVERLVREEIERVARGPRR